MQWGNSSYPEANMVPLLGKPLLFYNLWREKSSRWVPTTDTAVTWSWQTQHITTPPARHAVQCAVSVNHMQCYQLVWLFTAQWAMLQQQSQLLAKLNKQNMKALYQYQLKPHPPYIQTLDRHYAVSYWTIRSVKQLCKVSKIISAYNNTGEHTCTCHSLLLAVSDTQAPLQYMACRHNAMTDKRKRLTWQLCTDHRQYWQTKWKQSSCWAYNTGHIHSLLLLLRTCILPTLRATSSTEWSTR